jgi:hypothetical protein
MTQPEPFERGVPHPILVNGPGHMRAMPMDCCRDDIRYPFSVYLSSPWKESFGPESQVAVAARVAIYARRACSPRGSRFFYFNRIEP